MLDKSSKALMSCDLTNTIVSLFGETFLVAYFLQTSNENIAQVSMFYIILYTLQGLGTILLGNALKSNPNNRVTVYRLGIVAQSIYILVLVLLKNNIGKYFAIFAVLYGIAQALYWSAHDVMNIEIVDNHNRKMYMTTKRILSRIINILVPIILGTSIELTSFPRITIYIFILTLVQIIISLFIDIGKFRTDCSKQKYSLRNYMQELSVEQKTKLNKIYQLAFLYGIMMDTIRVLVIIITIMTFKTSMNLGILTTIFSICSMVSLYLFNKLYNKKYVKPVLFFCVIPIIIGVRRTIVQYK